MTLTLRFKVGVGTGRVGGFPGSKNIFLRQEKKLTDQGTKQSMWKEQVTEEERTHQNGVVGRNYIAHRAPWLSYVSLRSVQNYW